jgi:hypothetical protein
MAGSCEYGDEPSGSGTTELLFLTAVSYVLPVTPENGIDLVRKQKMT